MSFTNHPNGTDSNQNEFVPDAAGSSSYVSDHSTIVSNLTENSNSRSSRASSSRHTNQSDDSSSLRRDREREGRCADCGAETHEMRYDPDTCTQRKVPLNIEGEVHRGRCLLCNPLPARLNIHRGMRHQQQEQLPEAEEFENMHSGGSVTQQYYRESSFHSTGTGHRQQSSFHSTGTSQSLDGREGRGRSRHRSQRRTGRSDASVGSSQSYNSAPAQSYNTVSTQSYNSAPAFGNVSSQRSQQSNSTYPMGVTSSSDFNQSAAAASRAAPPLEEFTIHSSRGERQPQHREQKHPPQQRQQRRQQNFRQQFADNGRATSNNSILSDVQDENMALDEDDEQQYDEFPFTVTRGRTSQPRSQQQQQQQQQQQSPANNETAAIHQILSSIQRYPNHVPTQSKGLHSLWVLSWDDTNSENIGRLGGIPLILDSMRLHPNTPTLQSNGIATLQNLAMTSQNRTTITESDGVTVIVEVMAQFIEDKALQQSGCTALANLANGTSEQKACVAEGGGILAMMRAVDAHRGDESILRAAYQALRKLGYTPGS